MYEEWWTYRNDGCVRRCGIVRESEVRWTFLKFLQEGLR